MSAIKDLGKLGLAAVLATSGYYLATAGKAALIGSGMLAPTFAILATDAVAISGIGLMAAGTASGIATLKNQGFNLYNKFIGTITLATIAAVQIWDRINYKPFLPDANQELAKGNEEDITSLRENSLFNFRSLILPALTFGATFAAGIIGKAVYDKARGNVAERDSSPVRGVDAGSSQPGRHMSAEGHASQVPALLGAASAVARGSKQSGIGLGMGFSAPGPSTSALGGGLVASTGIGAAGLASTPALTARNRRARSATRQVSAAASTTAIASPGGGATAGSPGGLTMADLGGGAGLVTPAAAPRPLMERVMGTVVKGVGFVSPTLAARLVGKDVLPPAGTLEHPFVSPTPGGRASIIFKGGRPLRGPSDALVKTALPEIPVAAAAGATTTGATGAAAAVRRRRTEAALLIRG